jgi:Man1-Src1p-C-terminal domain
LTKSSLSSGKAQELKSTVTAHSLIQKEEEIASQIQEIEARYAKDSSFMDKTKSKSPKRNDITREHSKLIPEVDASPKSESVAHRRSLSTSKRNRNASPSKLVVLNEAIKHSIPSVISENSEVSSTSSSVSNFLQWQQPFAGKKLRPSSSLSTMTPYIGRSGRKTTNVETDESTHSFKSTSTTENAATSSNLQLQLGIPNLSLAKRSAHGMMKVLIKYSFVILASIIAVAVFVYMISFFFQSNEEIVVNKIIHQLRLHAGSVSCHGLKSDDSITLNVGDIVDTLSKKKIISQDILKDTHLVTKSIKMLSANPKIDVAVSKFDEAYPLLSSFAVTPEYGIFDFSCLTTYFLGLVLKAIFFVGKSLVLLVYNQFSMNPIQSTVITIVVSTIYLLWSFISLRRKEKLIVDRMHSTALEILNSINANNQQSTKFINELALKDHVLNLLYPGGKDVLKEGRFAGNLWPFVMTRLQNDGRILITETMDPIRLQQVTQLSWLSPLKQPNHATPVAEKKESNFLDDVFMSPTLLSFLSPLHEKSTPKQTQPPRPSTRIQLGSFTVNGGTGAPGDYADPPRNPFSF